MFAWIRGLLVLLLLLAAVVAAGSELFDLLESYWAVFAVEGRADLFYASLPYMSETVVAAD